MAHGLIQRGGSTKDLGGVHTPSDSEPHRPEKPLAWIICRAGGSGRVTTCLTWERLARLLGPLEPAHSGPQKPALFSLIVYLFIVFSDRGKFVDLH